MNLFEDFEGVYLTMQGYIEVIMMADKLGIDPTKGKRVNLPLFDDITDMTPCSKDEANLFMSATCMIGCMAISHRPTRLACVSLTRESVHGCAREGGTQGSHAHSSLLHRQQGALHLSAVGLGRSQLAHVLGF